MLKKQSQLLVIIAYGVIICLLIGFSVSFRSYPLWFRNINLIPFSGYINEPIIISTLLRDLFINILLFIPLSIYLLNNHISFKQLLLVGLILSLTIQVFKWVTLFGIFSTGDIILNIIGIIFVYFIFNRNFKAA